MAMPNFPQCPTTNRAFTFTISDSTLYIIVFYNYGGQILPSERKCTRDSLRLEPQATMCPACGTPLCLMPGPWRKLPLLSSFNGKFFSVPPTIETRICTRLPARVGSKTAERVAYPIGNTDCTGTRCHPNRLQGGKTPKGQNDNMISTLFSSKPLFYNNTTIIRCACKTIGHMVSEHTLLRANNVLGCWWR